MGPMPLLVQVRMRKVHSGQIFLLSSLLHLSLNGCVARVCCNASRPVTGRQLAPATAHR